MNNIDKIDLANERLTPSDVRLLKALMHKRLVYISQGRGREAHGIGQALLIVWQALMSPEIDIQLPDSLLADL